MYPENLRKIAHPDVDISNVNLILVRKKVNEQTNRHTRNLKLFGTNLQHPRNISRKFKKNSSSRTGDITDNLNSVRNWDNEQTDRHKKI